MKMKNILTVAIILGAAIVTHSAVAAELTSFQKATRCSLWASIAGDQATAQELTKYARLGMEEKPMYFEAGYASAVVQRYMEKTGDSHVIVAKNIFNASNCKALLPHAI